MEHSKSESASFSQNGKSATLSKVVSAPKSISLMKESEVKSPTSKEEKSNRIQQIKQSSHVTIIQSRWRGRMARIMDMKSKSKIVPAPLPLEQLRLRRTGTDYTLTKRSFVQTKRDTKLQKISVDKFSTIEFYIDTAGGLPYSCTVCRVSAKLLTSDRVQIGDTALASFSHPDSDYTSPAFTFHSSLKGSELKQDATFLCRIDTLESPSLNPKCVGYAALKLCCDATGQLQPSKANPASLQGVCLNAGEFLLPLHFGKIPATGLLTEELIQAMPQIEGAFVGVRLFDKTAERSSEPVFFAANYVAHMSKRSVASLVTHSHRFALSYTLPQLPLSSTLVSKILNDESLAQAERTTITKSFQDWFPSAFPDVTAMRDFVDPRFMIQYTHSAGCMLALDMLYNMPPRKQLIKAAATSATVQAILAGLSRGWDNKINLFKTSFRYLPGVAPVTNSPSFSIITPDASVIVTSRIPNNEGKQVGLGKKKLTLDLPDQAENIIDDASVKLILDSQECSPYYADDFSCTAGLQLNPTACILVIVTAVDVLTNSVPASKDTEEYPVIAQHQPITPKIPNLGKKSGFESFDEVIEHQKQVAKEERRKKLEGLIGIHMGHKDRRTGMWGLLPVHVECPCTVKVPPSVQPQTNKLERGGGGSGSSVGGSVHSMSVTGNSMKNKFFPVQGNIPESNSHDSNGSSNNNNNNNNNQGVGGLNLNPTITQHPLFVNAGTHQIPLFEGLPPEEMIHSPDPMAWLLQNLTNQNQKEMDSGFGLMNYLLGLVGKSSTPPSVAPSPAVPETDTPAATSATYTSKPKAKKAGQAVISSGSCAIVRLVDSRLNGINMEPLNQNFSKPLDETTLQNVLKARNGYVIEQSGSKQFRVDQRKYTKMHNKFSYFALKNAEHRSIRSAIPGTVDGETLIDEINTKFSQTLFNC